jgi:hypothetical protein
MNKTLRVPKNLMLDSIDTEQVFWMNTRRSRERFKRPARTIPTKCLMSRKVRYVSIVSQVSVKHSVNLGKQLVNFCFHDS